MNNLTSISIEIDTNGDAFTDGQEPAQYSPSPGPPGAPPPPPDRNPK